MNLKNPCIELLLEKHGVLGLGAYVLIKDTVLNYPRITDVLLALKDKVSKELIEDILKNSELFFTLDKVNYLHYTEKKCDLTTDDAYPIFDKRFPGSRLFDQMRQVYGISEEAVQEEFRKWKKSNEDFLFNDDRHLKNSFKFWMSKIERKKSVKEELDWDAI